MKIGYKNQKALIVPLVAVLLSAVALFVPKIVQAFTFGDDHMAMRVNTSATSNVEYSYLNAGEKLHVESIYNPNAASTNSGVATGDAKNYKTFVYAPNATIAGQCSVPDGVVGTTNGASCPIDIVASASGVYKIFSTNGFDAGLNYEIKVSDSSDNEITGRTWTNQVYLYQGCSIAEYTGNAVNGGNTCGTANGSEVKPVDYTSNLPRDLNFYAVNNAGNIYEVNLYKYQGFTSIISLDAAGNVTTAGSCTSAYESQGYGGIANALEGDPANPAKGNCAKFRLFYEEPNADLPVSAQSADGLLQILPVEAHSNTDPIASLTPSLDASTLVSNMQFSENLAATNKAGTLSFDISPNFSGNYIIQIDTNNNGSFNDLVDRTVDASAAGGSANNNISVDFDGKNGQGADISPNQTIKFRIKFDRLAETHLVLNDAEGLGGLTITAINGANAGDSTVYWNDTELVQYTGGTALPWGTTPVVDGHAGVNSAVAGGVHGWDYVLTSPTTGRPTTNSEWGDNRAIDTWVYLQTDIASNLTVTAGAMYTVDFVSNGGSSVPFQKVVPADTATEPTDPTRSHFTFSGWFTNSNLTNLYDFTLPVNSNKTLYAKWTEDAKCEYNDAIYADDENCVKPDEPVVPTEPDDTIPGKPDTGVNGAIFATSSVIILVIGGLVMAQLTGVVAIIRHRN
jgi:uncharacterized repeat protein (TIGR02543 family)